jgi:hypothetical protein
MSRMLCLRVRTSLAVPMQQVERKDAVRRKQEEVGYLPDEVAVDRQSG